LTLSTPGMGDLNWLTTADMKGISSGVVMRLMIPLLRGLWRRGGGRVALHYAK
jgi:hypothetical protein